MAKIARATQSPFATSAGAGQIAEFGSFAAGSPLTYSGTTVTPALVQALSQFTSGWVSAVVGFSNPGLEDMNALFYLIFYQLQYLFQEGVPEWDSGTTYYLGSIVQDGSGNLYVSQANTNLNNALSNSTYWLAQNQPTTQIFTSSGTWTAPAGVTRVRAIAEYGLMRRGFMLNQGSFMVDQNANLYAWGINNNGQLGINSSTAVSSPTLVVGGINPLAVAPVGDNQGGGSGSVYILDVYGNGYGVGVNTNGQLGNGSTTTVSSPVLISGGLKFKQLVGAWGNTTGISAMGLGFDGTLYAWGANGSGQLGTGNITPVSTPVAVLGGHQFTRVGMSGNGLTFIFSIGIDTSGNMWSWGYNPNGQLGNGLSASVSSPVQVVGGITWTDLSMSNMPTQGSENFLGLSSGGNVYVLGGITTSLTGSATPVSSPVAIISGKNIVQILSVGGGSPGQTVAALDNLGNAWTIGSNAGGLLGNNTTTAAVSTPTAVVGGIKFKKLYGLGSNSLYGIDTQGNLWAWGGNANGQLGNGTVTAASSPVAVAGGLKWVDVYPDSTYGGTSGAVFAVDTNGNIWGWGFNTGGQLGIGTSTAVSSPVLVAGPARYAAPNYTQKFYEMTVIPGQTYAVSVGGLSSFGGFVFDGLSSQITLEYNP